MDQSPCSGQSTDHRRDDAPFGDERYRYLRHCAEHGAAPAVVKVKRNQLLWIAGRLGPDARPWLRFLGWWREPTAVFQYQDQLDQWMRDERGFTASTVDLWGRKAGRFLRWCEQTNRADARIHVEQDTSRRTAAMHAIDPLAGKIDESG
jgi:hypothetical protein